MYEAPKKNADKMSLVPGDGLCRCRQASCRLGYDRLDSLIKRLDNDRYAITITPRKLATRVIDDYATSHN